MSKFGKKKKEMAVVSTASLPDIVFMLLFFFMLVTVLKDEDPKVKVIPPLASELTQIESKHLVQYINIGQPISERDREILGTAPLIQLNDYFADIDKVIPWVDEKRTILPESEKNKMIVALKVDKETKMRLVTAVKQELRKANALKLLYNTGQRSRTGK